MIVASQIGPVIGEGNVAEVRAYGTSVLKLYWSGVSKQSAFREAMLTVQVEALGLPVLRVLGVGSHDGRWGLVMTRAEGRPLAEAMLAGPDAVGAHLDTMVRLHRQMHACAVPEFPAMKARLAGGIGRAGMLRGDLRKRLLDALAALPDGEQLCHGDFHPYNVLGAPDAAVVIDWMDATHGAVAADVCRSFLLMRSRSPELAREYVERYCAASGVAVDDVMAWAPVLAGARLAEGIAGEADTLLALAETV